MEHSTLQFLWYLVIGIAMMMYTILDGFDLGVGALHLLARNDYERRVFLNSIGPVWDGNEVWLVIIVGGLFAGFPQVYATVFSGFYTLLTLLIACYMFRAVAIEFRSKREHPKWRTLWDVVFAVSSILIAFIIGLGLGNFVIGLPINSDFEFVGTLGMFFRPYAILVGLTGFVLFTMHGAIYLLMKTEGEVHEHVRKWIYPIITTFVGLYTLTTITTVLTYPHMHQRLREHPWVFAIPAVAFLAILNVIWQIKRKRNGWAFLSSSFSIILLLGVYGLGTFPILVRSTIDPDLNSITVYNDSSSSLTLKILLIIVAIGIPLVLAYTYYAYRIFRGKVKIEHTSY